jgi:hypothetical protein
MIPKVGQDVTHIVEALPADVVEGMLKRKTIVDDTEKREAAEKLLKQQRAKLASAKKKATVDKAAAIVDKAKKALERADTPEKKDKAAKALEKAENQLAEVKKG